MQAFSIVKQLDVSKQGGHRLRLGSRYCCAKVIEAFGFDRRPEGLAQSVVVAIPLAAHALSDFFLCQQQAEAFAGVLTASIRMMNSL